MRWLADIAYLLAGLIYLPIALYHALILGKNRRGWRQRFGGVPIFDPNVPRIWIHAVSLGEINATPRLVAALRERLPETDIVFSTTTDTGYARAVQLYGLDRVFRFPLDFSLVVSRVLRRVRPTMIVLVELEVWYNLVRMAARCGIPVAVVNGRLTQHSARRFRWLGPIGHSMFRDLTWVGAQDETIAARFRSVLVPADRIEVTSSLKWDTAAVTDRADGADELAAALGLDGSRPVWVCGSTGPGEEVMLLNAYRTNVRIYANRNRERPDDDRVAAAPRSDRPVACAPGSEVHGGPRQSEPQAPARGPEHRPDAYAPGSDCTAPVLILVPRKPERFDEVARLIANAGFTCVRRSLRPDGTRLATYSEDSVVLGDTMGELRKFYSLADVVFVGRSLVPLGGSDPMEVAALAKPIIVGQHFDNFESAVNSLRSAEAIRVLDTADDLPSVIGELLSDSTARARLGAAAREVVLRNQGATRRTADRLVRLMPVAGRTG
jgi:3-deoxy-D-manno-octulosonic-acid transferase